MSTTLPESMVFSTTNRRYLVLAATSAGFVMLLTFLRFTQDGPADPLNVMLTVLFALVTLIGVAAALLRRSWLKLARDGFESSELHEIGKLAWSDVSEIALESPRAQDGQAGYRIAFGLTRADHKAVTKLSGLMSGGRVHLKDMFSVRGEELVALMNAYRNQALVAAPQTGAPDH